MTILIKRNMKLFFKDKGMFITALITPAILLVLYATFLGNVYRDGFIQALPEGVVMPEKILGGLVGGQLVSSILAVSCVTVSFGSNMLSVQDKATGVIKDFTVSSVNSTKLALGYYFASLFSSLIICFTGLGACLLYLSFVGWYLSVLDVLLLALDVFLLVMFGTALSSVINFFLSTQGQISAVGTVISSCYGFICGAYMPISQFSPALQKVISFLPGTYGTALVRNHSLRGALCSLEKEGFPDEYIEGIEGVVDCNIYFFGNEVKISTMYIILSLSVLALILIYSFLHLKSKNKK